MSDQEQHSDTEELTAEDLDQVTGGVAQVGLNLTPKAPLTQPCQPFGGGKD